LATAIPLFLLLFATAYYLMSRAQGGAFSEPLTRTDALYFTITVFATVGFGDITAKTQTARVVTIVQMSADLLVLGLLIRVVLSAVETGHRKRAEGQPATNAPVPSAGPANGPHTHGPPTQ
jgi:voltage-gated potassium channel